MDFLLWAVRSLHVFGVIVWFGGVLYQAVVTREDEGRIPGLATRGFLVLVQPFVWMGVWTVLVTGIALTLFNPRFVFLRYDDTWSVLLGMKQAVFLVMMFFAFGHARMLARVKEMLSQQQGQENILPYYYQMLRLGRMNVALAILSILLAAGMR